MVAPWDRRSRAEQQRVTNLLLESWLPQAVTYAPHWAAVVEELGLTRDALERRRDLGRLPASRQADVATAGGPGAPDLVMRPSEAQVQALSKTSTLMRIAGAIRSEGAAGKRRTLLEEFKPIQVHRGGVNDQFAIASSRTDLDRMHRVGARAASVLGLSDHDYLVSMLPPDPRLAWWGLYHLALGSSMLAVHPRERGGDRDEDADLQAFGLVPVTVVAVPLDEAVELAGTLRDGEVELARVHTVITVGPPPDDEHRTTIADAWRDAGAAGDVRVRALWGPSEGRALWAECAEGTTGLHTYPDLEVLEVLDPITGEVTGIDGDLTLTTAGWHGTTLLRYRTGAWVDALRTDPCEACGRTVPRIAPDVVPEAWQPEVEVGDLLVRLDLRGVAAELATTPGARTWRTELRAPRAGPGDDRLIVEIAGNVSRRDEQVLADRIERGCGVRPAEIRVVADAEAVDATADELGTVFADLR